MRGAPAITGPSRVKGRLSLIRRLRALLLAAHRFSRSRSATADDRQFSVQLIDGLTATLQQVDPAAPRPEDRG